MTLKKIGQLFYFASNFVHHFIVIGEFKLKLQSGNTQFGSKSAIYFPRDLEIWRMTLKNNRAPLLCCFKLHHFIAISEFKLKLQSGNAQFGSKSAIFCPVWLWNLTDDLKKTIGNLFYATLSFVHHFVAIGEFKLELQSGNAQFGSKSTILWAVWPWNLTDNLEKNNRTPLLSSIKLYSIIICKFELELQSGNG